jgi:hypothetical protein
MSVTFCQVTFAPLCQLRFQALAALTINILLPSSGYDYLENGGSSQMLLTIYQTTRHHFSEDHSLKPYWLSQVRKLRRNSSSTEGLRQGYSGHINSSKNRAWARHVSVILLTYFFVGTALTRKILTGLTQVTFRKPVPLQRNKMWYVLCAVGARVQLCITINSGLIERCSQVSRFSATLWLTIV